MPRWVVKREGLILVCFALREEAAPFRKSIGGRTDVQILITGMGRKNAERSVREFLSSHSPQFVLSCGFAGGLNPKLARGTVVFDTDAPELREPFARAGATKATFCCAERIATTVAQKSQLRESSGADAVEMESEAIHEVCRARGIPCATVRVISDTADEALPLDFNQLMTPELTLNFRKLLLAVAKSPGKIGALLRLQNRTRRAAEALAGILRLTIYD